jgi:hypothetical protein
MSTVNPSTAMAVGRRAAFARSIPFALYIVLLAIESSLAVLLDGLDARWLYALRVGLPLLALIWFARDFGELREARRLYAPGWLATIGCGIAVFVLWINLVQPWATIGNPVDDSGGFDPRREDGGIDWPLALVRLAGAALVVPLIEELFWRSFLMRWIDRHDFLSLAPAAVGLRALLLSSLVFGFEHDLWLAGILAGLAYGVLYIRSGSLWAPVVAHSLTNLLLGLWVLATAQWHFW